MENIRDFKSLSPIQLEKNEDIYTEALNFAFINPEIRNIAITGIYGAGKSSVWKTFAKNKCLSDIIYISLGDYGKRSEEKNKAKSQPDELTLRNRIERQIINQILSQINSKDIPLGKYKLTKNRNKIKISFWIVLLFLGILGVVILNTTNLLFYFWGNEFLQEILRVISYLLIIVPIVYVLYRVFITNQIQLSKINIKGAEATLDVSKHDDETVLERDMREIVYLLTSAKVKTVVFEDLDRFENIEVFTKLRELNFLLNSYLAVNNKVNNGIILSLEKLMPKKISCISRFKHRNINHPTRFVYLVKDDLFDARNRTKFFDFILPIVPVIDSKHSEDVLINHLERAQYKPDTDVIIKLSNYIDDMRLALNISNEYSVYENIIPIDELKLNPNKLLGLIVLKNLCPNEFDDLQHDRGYIIQALENIKSLKEKKERELLNNFKKINSTDSEYQDIKEQLQKLRLENISEFLADLVSNEIDEIFSENQEKIFESDYNHSLIKILILEGLLDDTYWHYKSSFRPGAVGKNGQLFINSLYEHKKQSSLLVLENPDEVINRLGEHDYDRPNILNSSLLKACVDLKRYDLVERTLNSVKHYGNLDDFIEVLISFDRKTIIDLVLASSLKEKELFLEVLVECQSRGEINVFRDVLLGIYSIPEVSSDCLLEFNNYIESNEDLLIGVLDQQLKCIYQNFELAGVKLEDLEKSKLTGEQLDGILQIRGYKLSISNVRYILNVLVENEVKYGEWLSIINEEPTLSYLKDYIFDEYTDFIGLYIDSKEDASFTNNEEVIFQIIRSNVSIEQKVEYLKNNLTIINDASKLPQYIPTDNLNEIYTQLFSRNTLAFTAENLNTYWTAIKQYVPCFVEYFNDNLSDESKQSVLEDVRDICDCLICDSDLSDSTFLIMLPYINSLISFENKEIEEGYPEDRVIKIAKNKKLDLSSNLLKELIQNKYYDVVLCLVTSEYSEGFWDIIENNSDLIQKELVDYLITKKLEEDLITRVIENFNDLYDMNKIPLEYRTIIADRLEHMLSVEDIKYIFDIFDNFPCKEEFFKALNRLSLWNKIDIDWLSKSTILFCLHSEIPDVDSKIALIEKMIIRRENDSDIAFYLSQVIETKELARVFNHGRPEMRTDFEKKIGRLLIDNGYVKRMGQGNRIYQPNRNKNMA